MDKVQAHAGGFSINVSQRCQLTLAGWGLLRAALLEKVHYTQKMVGKLGPLHIDPYRSAPHPPPAIEMSNP